MSLPLATVLRAQVEFIHRDFLKSLRLSSGEISEITEARVSVDVELLDGRQAVGRGSVYLSHQWAWREGSLLASDRDNVLRQLCVRIADTLPGLSVGQSVHPLEYGLLLHQEVLAWEVKDCPSALSRTMCASPFDAAIHDAVGAAVGRSAFQLYDCDMSLELADRCFHHGGAAAAIRDLLNPTVNELQSWLVVGVSDDLDDTIYDWGVRRGYRGFKLKTHGGSPALDASWTAEVYRTARKFGITSPRLSADSNEGNATVESVEEYLTDLRRIDAEAYDALEYLEQPTSRHVELISQDWRPVTRMKPVFLDEGLTDAEDFIKAKKAGWSGFAIKTCKGHSFCLVAAAWARQNGLELVMQDLTNPGFAAVHSALFASHIDPRNGIELNSPQFTPQANAEWLPRLQLLLEPTDGVHRLPGIDPIGLGSRL